MTKKLLCVFLSMSIICGAGIVPYKASYAQTQSAYTRQMEYLDRGLVAVKTTGGVYLSWRLLGSEEMSATFDIYRNGVKIVSGLDSTNYTDDEGFDTFEYQVAPAGGTPCESVSVWSTNYLDVPIDKPADGITVSGESYTYSANDASVADVDGDGQYEIILKWDPSNAKDNSQSGYTGNVYIDAYKMNGTKLWRIDLGINIRAGAHYTQFIAYDFDGDGKAEMACRTAPGSKDSAGTYVTAVGKNITSGDDTKDYRNSSGVNISSPDYLTMFNGETGKAMRTIDYVPQRGTTSSWGDSYGNRSERYLAGVAYLNGKTPSLIMCRGYYQKASMAAFNWDGTDFTMLWSRVDTSKSGSSIYGQGTHSLSVADVDNDGYDEIIFGSAVVDNDGSVLNTTGHGHGDALHVSDFDGDGDQEIYMVHEEYYKDYGAELRDGKTGTIQAAIGASSDTGRGVMDNIDASNAGSEFWSSADSNLYNASGTVIGTVPSSMNFTIYWDGDLTRELLDKNRITKYSISGGETRLETFSGVHYNNGTKATPSLSADLFGDWREEVMYPLSDDTGLRIYTTVTPTNYKLTTLMHDSQYRCAVAWQNVAYNQPPHTSYFIDASSYSSLVKPNISYAAVPTVQTTPTPTPDEVSNAVIERETFSSVTDSWGFTSGSVSTDSAPYKSVWTLSSGMATKTLGLSDSLGTQYDVDITSFALSDDNKTATAQIKNNKASSISPVILMAAYNGDGTLASVDVEKTEIAGGASNSIQVDAGEIPQGGTVKAMLLESLESLKPMIESITPNKKSVSKASTDNKYSVLRLSFAWKVGSGSNTFSVLSDKGDNIVTLSKASGSPIQYKMGSSTEAKTVNSTLNGNSIWYHVSITMDFTSKTADISVLDYSTTGATTKYVYSASFASCTGSIANAVSVSGACSLDNFELNSISYNTPRSLVSFNVTDSSGAAVSDAAVSIGGKTLTTASDGGAAIKLSQGQYAYAVKKAAYKTALGTVDASADVSKSITMANGEMRSVYIQYKNLDGITIKENTAAGTAVENTTYTVPDSAKGDIAYTDDSGQTVVYEYDADNSSSTDVTVVEDSDTYVTLYYKEKLAPVAGLDSDVLRINFSEDGIGKSYWTASNSSAVEYTSDESGVKYALLSGLSSNNISVALPSGMSKFVIESDILFSSLDWGGNVFGITPYSGSTKGMGIGIRTSSSTTNKWQAGYSTGSGSNFTYATYTNSTYTAPSYLTNQWAHFIITCDGTQMYLTLVNKNTGVVYVNNQAVTLNNNVGTSSAPVTKLVFGKILGSGTGAMGLSNLKVYTVGTDTSENAIAKSAKVNVPGETSFALTAHTSDVEGVSYDISSLVSGITYELQDMNGNAVSPTGFSLSSGGVLTIADSASTGTPYRVVVKVNGYTVLIYNLEYLKKTLTTDTALTFDSGVGGATITSATGYAISNSNGTLKYTKTAGTAYNSNVILNVPVTTQALPTSFQFSFDAKIVSGSFKGYLYLTDSSNNEYCKFETHMYTPRFKLIDLATSYYASFNTWYTIVVTCNNGAMTSTIYAQSDTERTNPLSTASATITNATYNGLKFRWQVAQNTGSGSASYADEYYLDNFIYSYYTYQ